MPKRRPFRADYASINRERTETRKPLQYEIEAQAIREITEHLRALRLARGPVDLTTANAQTGDEGCAMEVSKVPDGKDKLSQRG